MFAAISLLLIAVNLTAKVMWSRAIYIGSDREWMLLRTSMFTAAVICGLNLAAGRPILAAVWLTVTAVDVLVFQRRRRTQALAVEAARLSDRRETRRG